MENLLQMVAYVPEKQNSKPTLKLKILFCGRFIFTTRWFLTFSAFVVDHALYTERYGCFTLIKDVLFYIVYDTRLYLANITTEYIDTLSPDVTIIEENSIKIKVSTTFLP